MDKTKVKTAIIIVGILIIAIAIGGVMAGIIGGILITFVATLQW